MQRARGAVGAPVAMLSVCADDAVRMKARSSLRRRQSSPAYYFHPCRSGSDDDVWLPVFPLRRERLRVLTDFENETPKYNVSFGQLTGTQGDRYQPIESLPLSLAEVLTTLIATYVLLPMLLLTPMFLGVLALAVVHAGGGMTKS